MDIEFAHPTDPRDDYALADAIGGAHGKMVLAATEIGPGGSNGILGGESALRELGARAAEAILTVDSDGAVRRFAYSYSGLQSFAVVTAEIATGSPHRRGALRRRHPADRLRGPAGHGPVDLLLEGPAGQVLAGAVPRQDRDRRRVGAGAAGRAPHGHQRHERDAGPGNLGERDRDAAAGRAAAGAPGWLNLALIALLGASSRWAACACARGARCSRRSRWRSSSPSRSRSRSTRA